MKGRKKYILTYIHTRIHKNKKNQAQSNTVPHTHLLVISVSDGERLIHRKNISIRLPRKIIPVAEIVAIGVEDSTEFEIIINSIRPTEVSLRSHLTRSCFEIGGRESQGEGAGRTKECECEGG